MLAKMMSEMPLPMPRSVACSPIHMMKRGARGEREHRHEPEAPARVRHDVREATAADVLVVQPLEPHRDAERLEDARARWCRSASTARACAARLALLAQLVDLLRDHAQELHDDARRDVRHDAEREDATGSRRAPPENRLKRPSRPLCPRDDRPHHAPVDAGSRDEDADAVDGEDHQGEPDATAQLGNLGDVGKPATTAI